LIKTVEPFIQKYKKVIIYLLSIAGGIFYFIQAKEFALTQASVIDEGAYLYKGYLFASGQGRPFEQYGILTNHMPLAFLIPGYIQVWFGLGLRTARVASILISMVGLSGLWIVARRMAGAGWAAVSIWMIALNPAYIKTFSVAVSQGTVFTMVAWIMVLILGSDRKTWQLVMGSILSALLMMTRLNLVPLTILVPLYIFWQYGKKSGSHALLASALTLIIGHLIYWPDILNLWVHWLPDSLGHLLYILFPKIPPKVSTFGEPVWISRYSPEALKTSVFFALRSNLIVLLGFVASILLLTRQLKELKIFKAVVFLQASFLLLLVEHSWATFTGNHCVYCLESYITFWGALGILLLILTHKYFPKSINLVISIIFSITVILMSFTLTYSNLKSTVTNILEYQAPPFDALFTSSRTVEIWVQVANKFHIPYSQQALALPIVLAALACIALFLAAMILQRKLKNHARPRFGFMHILLITTSGLSLILSPSHLLAGYPRIYECSLDVVSSYEAAGEKLQELVPENAAVFWHGGLSVAPLLYIPSAQINYPLINSNYSHYTGDNSDGLLRLGYWNDALAKQWLEEAEYILVTQEFYSGWLEQALSSGPYALVGTIPPIVDCRQNAPITVFKRMPD